MQLTIAVVDRQFARSEIIGPFGVPSLAMLPSPFCTSPGSTTP